MSITRQFQSPLALGATCIHFGKEVLMSRCFSPRFLLRYMGRRPIQFIAAATCIALASLLTRKLLSHIGSSSTLQNLFKKVISNNNKIALRFFIAAGAHVNAVGRNGNTPLREAIEKGNIDIVQALIAAGADVNVVNSYDEPPLYLAIEKGNIGIVQALIAAGANVNVVVGRVRLEESVRSYYYAPVVFENRYAPLFWAIEKGNIDIVKALIAAGARVNAVGRNGSTPLCGAIEKGNIDIVQALIAAGVDVNVAGRRYEAIGTPLRFAIGKRRADIVQALIAAGADVNAVDGSSEPLLYGAVVDGDIDTVRVLINAGANVNAVTESGDTPLRSACCLCSAWKQGDVISRALVAAGAVIDEDVRKFASMSGYRNFVAYLESVPELSVRLQEAVQRRDRKATQELIAKGAPFIFGDGKDIFDYIIDGYNAADSSADDIAKDCIKHFGHALRNKQGQTALHIAVQRGNRLIVEYLLRNRAIVNTRDALGNTPLHYATSLSICNKLLSHGADVSLINYRGETAISAQTNTWLSGIDHALK